MCKGKIAGVQVCITTSFLCAGVHQTIVVKIWESYGTFLNTPPFIYVLISKIGLNHFKSIQAYGRHFLLTFCTPEIQGDRMNFSPGKLDYCYEHSGIQGMFSDDPGFYCVLPQ